MSLAENLDSSELLDRRLLVLDIFFENAFSYLSIGTVSEWGIKDSIMISHLTVVSCVQVQLGAQLSLELTFDLSLALDHALISIIYGPGVAVKGLSLGLVERPIYCIILTFHSWLISNL